MGTELSSHKRQSLSQPKDIAEHFNDYISK